MRRLQWNYNNISIIEAPRCNNSNNSELVDLCNVVVTTSFKVKRPLTICPPAFNKSRKTFKTFLSFFSFAIPFWKSRSISSFIQIFPGYCFFFQFWLVCYQFLFFNVIKSLIFQFKQVIPFTKTLNWSIEFRDLFQTIEFFV